MKIVSCLLLCVGLVVMGIPSKPCLADDEKKSIVLDEVVVSATRTETEVDKAPASVSVVNQEDLERITINRLDEALRYADSNPPAGLFLGGQRNGTYGRRATIHELNGMAGGINITGEFDRQYLEISPEYVITRNPDVIVISYWQEKQKAERLDEIIRRPGFNQVKAVKTNRIYAINGHDIHTTLRFAEALRDLVRFIHPELSDGVAK